MSFSKLMTLGQLKSIGVKDDRWTVQDKLVMYKGIIKIHSREQKNQLKDTNVLKKHNYRKIAVLRKEVKELHEKVATVMQGDKSVIRRLLYNHKELQKTFMNMDFDKIIEDLNHRLFCRKKNLNVIRHKKSQKANQLLNAYVYLEDLQTIINTPKNASDLRQQTLTNAIQNYDVKFCAAKNIQSVYRRMLAVLYKDQRYYEAILVTLQSDSNLQHKCLIRATEMGQLATEEMANMKAEYARLEKEVRSNMIEREFNLKEIRDRLVDLHEETQGLVRTESEFDMQVTEGVEEPRKKGKDLEQELRELHDILARLQEVTLVPDIKNILPSMLLTLRQKRRLSEELKLNAAACDDMLNKKNHADLMFYSLYHSGAESAKQFQAEYELLQNKINHQKQRIEKIMTEQSKVSKQSVRLRSGLQRLSQILEEVKTPEDYIDEEVPSWPVHNIADILRPKAVEEEEGEIAIRPPINQEALRLIHLIDAKMKFIKLRLKEGGDEAEQERAFVAHFKHVSEFMSSNLYSADDVVEAPALVVEVVLEDSQVPNRAEIKARSQEIYIEATKNPFEVVEPKTKSKKGKKK